MLESILHAEKQNVCQFFKEIHLKFDQYYTRVDFTGRFYSSISKLLTQEIYEDVRKHQQFDRVEYANTC